MTDSPSPHLSDQILNGYLDQALESHARDAAAVHLAGCVECSARLHRLQALFASLDALPEAPLTRDLRSGVMAAVRAKQSRLPLRPSADWRQPAFRLVFAGQLLLALILFAIAWPFIANWTSPFSLTASSNWNGLAVGLSTVWLDLLGLWSAAATWPPLALPALPLAAALPPLIAGLVLAVAGVGWLLGNALLLRLVPSPRRQS